MVIQFPILLDISKRIREYGQFLSLFNSKTLKNLTITYFQVDMNSILIQFPNLVNFKGKPKIIGKKWMQIYIVK